MKRILFGLLSLALLSSVAASSGFSLKNWLPNFAISWWWGEEEADSTTEDLDALALLSEGNALLDFPHADSLSSRFEWPLISTDPVQAQRNWETSRSQSVLLQNEAIPLALESHPLLLHRPEIEPSTFLSLARRFAPVHAQTYEGQATLEVLPLLEKDQTVILFVDNNALRGSEDPRWYKGLIGALVDQQVILVHFGLSTYLSALPDNWTALQLPKRHKESEAFAAQALFGAQTVDGQLARAIGSRFESGAGDVLYASRPGYELPSNSGWSLESMEQIDDRVNWALRRRTTPGAQLLVMRNGQIVLEKAYGHHTYRRREPVKTDDLFDLASVTKAAATSFVVMHLYDRGLIDLSAKVKDYLPEFEGYPVGRYRVDYLLTHNTGLQADVPAINYLGREYVQDHFDPGHEFQIAPERWLDNDVPGQIEEALKKVKYTRRPIHRYSDANYYLLQLIVESRAGQSMDGYLEDNFYTPMGLKRLAYRPFQRFAPEQMVPSVYDPWMREATLRGFVHDESAALLGGVAGHAGLFGNARDLGLLFQLLLDNGRFEDQQLIQESTVELFTSRYTLNHRALAFDRLNAGWANVVKAGAGESTFGHTGFSGTCVWADPEQDLIFVLLTNRVFPDTKNTRFMRYNVRGKIHRDVYQGLAVAK